MINSTSLSVHPKVLLIILDGFGYSTTREHNAVELARSTFFHELLKKYPYSFLKTSGEAVGLPAGIMGNSEVGHLNIGGGRVIPQELTRITNFAQDNGFESLPDVKRVISDPTGTLHLIGLLSDGGVHSDQEHLYLLVDAANRVNPKKPVHIHVITDGRDTPPTSAKGYIESLMKRIQPYPQAKIASVMGRFFAMDRDKRWDRVETAYKVLSGQVKPAQFDSAVAAISNAYANAETDEFVKARWIQGGSPIQSQDQVIFFNFRADRAREISQAFAIADFNEFSTPVKVNAKNWVTFTSYQKDFPFPVLFTPKTYSRILGEELARRGHKQLRVAETEKYAHVTYFFNGGSEKEFAGEDRVLVPSPKEVATYDLKPEMSAPQVTQEVMKGLKAQKYTLIVVNYANGDMVGHTGVESAAIKAVETLDASLSQVVPEALKQGFDVLITADHGNCEQMIDPKSGQPFTQHTTNPVYFIWVGPDSQGKKLNDGILADIAPTVLKILNWEQPTEMTGQSLIS